MNIFKRFLNFRCKTNTINWKYNDKKPKDQEEIVFVTRDFVCLGTYEEKDNIVSMYAFMGMPFYNFKEVKYWVSREEFKNYIHQWKKD